MLDYQQRVVEERMELGIKLDKLEAYQKSEDFKSLSIQERSFMNTQEYIMRAYSNILSLRIDLFLARIA